MGDSTSTTGLVSVAFPGAHGAYCQRAARGFFAQPYVEVFCGDAAEAVRSVSTGHAVHAVLPVENSLAGPFADVAEAFFAGQVRVVGETVLMIRHCLLASPGTSIEDVSVVTSHPSTLAQCRDWLARWSWATRPTDDVTAAARDLGRSDESALAILGSWELGATHGLDVLVEGVADEPDNRTRFLVIGAGNTVPGDGHRHALRVGPVSTPRTRKSLRIQLESLGASRVRVPFLGSSDGRRFLVEFDHVERVGREIAEEACEGILYEHLGSWNPGASP